jgi:hypothetical protein
MLLQAGRRPAVSLHYVAAVLIEIASAGASQKQAH